MKAKNIMDALEGIDYDLIEAAENSTPAKRLRLPRWAAFAASLALVIAAAAVIFPRATPGQETNETAKNRYKEGTNVIASGELAVEWPWEWKTEIEKYPEMVFEGNTYRTRARMIGSGLLEGKIGSCEAAGYDVYTETVQKKTLDVYAIRGVNRDLLAAVKFDEGFVVFLRDQAEMPKTLGELMGALSLPQTLRLEEFCEKEGAKTGDWYRTNASDEIWKALEGCAGAPCQIVDSFNADGISFSVTSEELGIRMKALSITENGYLTTNLMEYGYAFNIGEEAAEKIIRLAKNRAVETEPAPYIYSIAGTLKEIGDGYILVDDTILCREEKDGIIYRVLTEELRIRRCLEFLGGFQTGDLVVVSYEGHLEAGEEYVVRGAVSLAKGQLESDGAVSVPE